MTHFQQKSKVPLQDLMHQHLYLQLKGYETAIFIW
jgi:hypothetical protein